MDIDIKLLEKFENGLNPAYPEKSVIRPVILGYGEISTTFSLREMPDIAFKRMPPFDNLDQISEYKRSVDHYCMLLNKECNISVSDFVIHHFANNHGERILYVAQPKLDATTIGNEVLKSGTIQDLKNMLVPVINHLLLLMRFNLKNSGHEQVGLDGQLSNWSFPKSGLASESPVYFDITTPMYRVNGVDQLDTEIFLKSCPSFLVWLVRWQFLQEVLDRYYDVRLILIDIVANFFKEGRKDLIDESLNIINSFLKENEVQNIIGCPTYEEVESYYKNDAFIWALFLFLRRFDRFIKTRVFRQRYNFILPGKIKR